jgi:hypothetical protein
MWKGELGLGVAEMWVAGGCGVGFGGEGKGFGVHVTW